MQDKELKEISEALYGMEIPWNDDPWDPNDHTIDSSLQSIACRVSHLMRDGWRLSQRNFRRLQYRIKFLEGTLMRIAEKDVGLAGDIAREALQESPYD